MNFLPGWGMGFLQAGTPPPEVLTEILQNASASSSGSTINVPGTVVAGDLLVLLDWAVLGSPAAVTPSGFTQAFTVAGESSRLSCTYKIAVGGEGTITGMNGGANCKLMVTFRGNIPLTTAVAASTDAEIVGSGGNPNEQVVASGSGAVPLVVLGLYTAAGISSEVTARSFTPAKDSEVHVDTGDEDAYIAWKIYMSSPADVTIDETFVGSRAGLGSCYIAVT